MKFIPKKKKFKKASKGHLLNNSPKALDLFAMYGISMNLIAINAGRLRPEHFNFLHLKIRKKLKRNVVINMLSFPHTPVSSKPLEVRMGKGKGSFDYWAANVFSGTPILKLTTGGLNEKIAFSALKHMRKKLPIYTVPFYKNPV